MRSSYARAVQTSCCPLLWEKEGNTWVLTAASRSCPIDCKKYQAQLRLTMERETATDMSELKALREKYKLATMEAKDYKQQ